MPRTIFCWRCNIDVPMLTEEEWALVKPESVIEEIKQYREATGCSLAVASQKGWEGKALAAYEYITGFKETNPNALFHHRLSLYGPPCHSCGKPLRTPKAEHCAVCGAKRVDHIDVQ